VARDELRAAGDGDCLIRRLIYYILSHTFVYKVSSLILTTKIRLNMVLLATNQTGL
jgi:hypothetical protein